MRTETVVVGVLGGVLGWSSFAQGQWVSFSDETDGRLTLSSLIDAPGSDPFDDDEEKDIAAADFNRDGWLDAVVVRKRVFSNPGARQDILLMNENGVLVDRTAKFAPGFRQTLTDARAVITEDMDGDGWRDVVIANTFDQQPLYYRNLGNDESGEWLGLVNESAARFPTITVLNLTGPRFCAVAAGDVNGDGSNDLFFSNYNNNPNSLATTDVLLINDGSGNFTDESDSRLGNLARVAFGTDSAVVDMDGDGDNDIVKISTEFTISPFPIGTYILWNDGAGNFATFDPIPGSTMDYMIAVDDFNGDDTMDVYITGDFQDSVHLSTHHGPNDVSWQSFAPSPSLRTTNFGGNTKAADIDNDGDPDIGLAPVDVDVANCNSGPNLGEFALLRNDGTGRFSDPFGADQNIQLRPHDFVFADVNNDNCLDVFMGLCTGWRVFVQQNCPVYSAADFNLDGTANTFDAASWFDCFTGPGNGPPMDGCHRADFDRDNDIDFADFGSMQPLLTDAP